MDDPPQHKLQKKTTTQDTKHWDQKGQAKARYYLTEITSAFPSISGSCCVPRALIVLISRSWLSSSQFSLYKRAIMCRFYSYFLAIYFSIVASISIFWLLFAKHTHKQTHTQTHFSDLSFSSNTTLHLNTFSYYIASLRLEDSFYCSTNPLQRLPTSTPFH